MSQLLAPRPRHYFRVGDICFSTGDWDTFMWTWAFNAHLSIRWPPIYTVQIYSSSIIEQVDNTSRTHTLLLRILVHYCRCGGLSPILIFLAGFTPYCNVCLARARLQWHDTEQQPKIGFNFLYPAAKNIISSTISFHFSLVYFAEG